MKIDLAGLATTIRKLQELHKLAGDPDLAPFISLNSVRKNGASAKGSKPYESELGQDVMNAFSGFAGNFTVADVYDAMKVKSYKFSGEEPKKSIGNILRALAGDGVITVVQKGRGRRASLYHV